MACSFCGESKKIPQWKSKEAKQVTDSPGHTILKKMKSTGKEIGRGAYGRVFEVEYGKIQYAAKEVHSILLQYASSEGLQKIKADFLNECHIWDQLQHPCIVQFMGVYYPAKNSLPVIVMEKMEFSLKGLVERYSNIQWEKKLSILNDICFGLEYLHSRSPPIVHRDLTPNNILLCSHLRAKITDLGVAKVMHTTDTKTLTQAPGTSDFMPPECLANKPVYGLPLDIFSFGGVVLYVTTQEWPQPAPWVDFDPNTGGRIVLTELQRRQQYLDRMTGAYTDLKPLVISCLDDNPKNRPLVEQALLKIKQVKDAYSEKMYCTVSPTGEQSTTQVQKQPEKPSSEQQTLQPQKTTKVHNKPSSSASHPSSMPKRSYDMLFKLLLIGDSGSGKTSILHRYGDDYNNDFTSTIGTDFKIKTIEINGKKIKLQIWDTAGQERFRAITTAYYRGAVGIMLVFDITHEKSFNNITNWLKDIEMHASSDVELLLVGNNQCDLEYDREVSYYRAQQMAESLNISYIETNTKTNHNIDEAFEMLVKQILKKKEVTRHQDSLPDLQQQQVQRNKCSQQ